MQTSSSKFGFTLAEVLITLGIIGIVAEMTIPVVLGNVKEQQRIAQLKKVYSTLSQAYNLSVLENGTPENWGLGADPVLITAKFSPYLRVQKDCGKSGGCLPTLYKGIKTGSYTTFNNPSYYSTMALNDGTALTFTLINAGCEGTSGTSSMLQHVCIDVFADINGFKSPNTVGLDMFGFHITSSGVIPYGSSQDTSASFKEGCLDKGSGGRACAAWVLFNGNFEYTKCDTDLDWNKKSTCQ